MVNKEKAGPKHGLLARITEFFVDSKLVPLIILLTLLLGIFAIFKTPSEEEPQIRVPMIDIFVRFPGATAREVENRVVYPMEKLLWEIPGVEYVYSRAQNGQAMTTVRFLVGEDVEKSVVKTYDKLFSHLDWMPPGCLRPLLKARSIDDVPIVSLTFWGKQSGRLGCQIDDLRSPGPVYDGFTLRKIVAQVDDEIRNIPGISETMIKGGQRREVRIILDSQRLASVGLDLEDVCGLLWVQNQAGDVGSLVNGNYVFLVRLNNFFSRAEDVRHAVLLVKDGHPIYLGDVAQVVDGPEEPRDYVFFVPGPGAAQKGIYAHPGQAFPAVTLAISKRKGWNATFLARQVEKKVEELKGVLIPDGVQVTVTRNYGETAKEKSNELLEHLFIATVAVAFLVALFLGFRACLIVMIAVPVTLAITLFIYYFYGYTLNRVTLFALIFCIGLLVDDPIVDVENIVRHLHLPENRNKPFTVLIVDAVNEVRSPLVLATFTVVAAILPMAFVGGLMGPYMRPMPVGASVAMILSMLVAFVVTPWTARHILGSKAQGEKEREDVVTRAYRWFMSHLIARALWRWSFFGLVGLLFIGACSLICFKVVYVKMLPFDNKSELQVIVDMPEGTSLEETARVSSALGQVLLNHLEVTDYELYVGTAAPFNFNGLIRHYYLRQGSNVADIQVNLVPKDKREMQSHDLAKLVRPELQAVASKFGARIKVAEVPPGPPVLQTLVMEVYGPDYEQQIALARKVKGIFEQTPGVVDVDWYMTDPQKEYAVILNEEKAQLSQVSPQRIKLVLETALKGRALCLLHDPRAKEDVRVLARFARSKRASLDDLQGIYVKNQQGKLIPLGELVEFRSQVHAHPIYHKNLKPVVYVTADVGGVEESPVYAMLKMNKELEKVQAPDGQDLKVYYARQPFSTQHYALKWDGEWQITYEVFRDLGLAFGAVIILIYILVVGWFKSYSIPLTIMTPIPLSLIGIIPVHALIGAFFTATSMIGFIAGAGIVVRNSIILVDFIQLRLSQGMALEEAVIDAGAMRFRPMLLTALSVVVGSSVILFDPIFQGLAVSLMAGELASTLFSRMVVPILFYLDERMVREKRLVF